MGDFVIVNDVGPRDGLQNQVEILSISERINLIKKLLDAGVKHIEIGAFVSPKAVPQMSGSDEVARILVKGNKTEFSALIPNVKGYELALEAGIRKFGMVVYASNGMSEKNVRMTKGQSDNSALEILSRAKDDGVDVAVTIAVSFVCPFDGIIDPDVVTVTAQKFFEKGAKKIVIADTIGAATPLKVQCLMSNLTEKIEANYLSCHFHDTRALGLANVYSALECGVREFDSSIAGLGGCPFAPGASGNIATEDLTMLLQSMGFETGIDLKSLLLASDFAQNLIGKAPGGRAKFWLKKHLEAGNSL